LRSTLFSNDEFNQWKAIVSAERIVVEE